MIEMTSPLQKPKQSSRPPPDDDDNDDDDDHDDDDDDDGHGHGDDDDYDGTAGCLTDQPNWAIEQLLILTWSSTLYHSIIPMGTYFQDVSSTTVYAMHI